MDGSLWNWALRNVSENDDLFNVCLDLKVVQLWNETENKALESSF